MNFLTWFSQMGELSHYIQELYVNGRADRIVLVYQRRESMGQRPQCLQLLRTHSGELTADRCVKVQARHRRNVDPRPVFVPVPFLLAGPPVLVAALNGVGHIANGVLFSSSRRFIGISLGPHRNIAILGAHIAFLPALDRTGTADLCFDMGQQTLSHPFQNRPLAAGKALEQRVPPLYQAVQVRKVYALYAAHPLRYPG